MKRIVRLTENDLTRIVRKVIKEQQATSKQLKVEFYGDSSETTKVLSGIAKVSQPRSDKPEYILMEMSNGGNINYFCNSPSFVFDDFNNKELHGKSIFNKKLTEYLKQSYCNKKVDNK